MKKIKGFMICHYRIVKRGARLLTGNKIYTGQAYIQGTK